MCGLDAYGSGLEPVADSCEHNNQPSGFIRGREFDSVSDC
jgi:hypothetical protein